MNYEKKYKEALKRAEKALEVLGTDKCEGARQIFSLFPELKESEDEKIRKGLIQGFNECLDSSSYPKNAIKYWHDIVIEDILAWLEKQGEQSSAIRWYDVSLIPQEMKELLVEWDSEDATWHEIAFYHADTKTFWNGTRQVENVTRWCYIIDLLEKQGEPSIKWNKNTKDCKPKVNHSVLMKTTHGIAEGEWQGEYWHQYRWASIVRDSDVLSWMELSDLEKQEGHGLAKLSEEDDIDEEYKIGKWFTGLIPCWINAPSTLQPEHSNHGKNVVAIHLKGGGYRCCCIDDKPIVFDVAENTPFEEGWHNKESSAWSEEDEKMCQETIDWFEKKCFPYALEEENPAKKSITWLKSLKDRCTWKPNEEQLDALKRTQTGVIQFSVLQSLYNDLKKLSQS